MRNFILGGLLTFFLTGRQDTSPGLILEGNPRSRISVRVGRHSLRDCKYFFLSRISIVVIFCLQGGKEVTTLFVGKGEIVLVLVLHLILHICLQSILSCNADSILG